MLTLAALDNPTAPAAGQVTMFGTASECRRTAGDGCSMIARSSEVACFASIQQIWFGARR